MLISVGEILAGFGLASASGLNAYIPLLAVGVAGRLGWLRLVEPYNLLQNEWVLLVLALLLGIEMLVDKVPAVDTVNDLIQTLIRPAAGAVLFAANAKVITDLQPAVALALGLIVAFGVHATKATARPVVSAATLGTGNWAVSLLEDVVSFLVSLLSILAPLLAGAVVVLLALFVFRRLTGRGAGAPPQTAPLRWPK